MNDIQNQLARVFRLEWSRLSPAQQALVERDARSLQPDDTLREYRRRIGRGNLFAYARVLEAQASRS